MRRKKLTKMFLIGMVLLFLTAGCGPDPDIMLEAESSDSEEMVLEKSAADKPEEKTEPEFLYIYICGEIQKPGVYCMKEGDRVFRLIEKAGGLTRKADVRAVNQAEILSDGTMIYIPSQNENKDGSLGVPQNSKEKADGKVNINTASAEELMTLSGIGEGKAQSIISYRQDQGKFQSIEDIMNVDGIKEGVFNRIKDKITV